MYLWLFRGPWWKSFENSKLIWFKCFDFSKFGYFCWKLGYFCLKLSGSTENKIFQYFHDKNVLCHIPENNTAKIRGDLNNKHLNPGNIWKTNFYLFVIQMPGNSLLLKPSVMQPYDLNDRILICYSSHDVNNGSFKDRIGLDHSNTKLVRFSDCITISAPLTNQASVSTPTYTQMPLTSTLSTASTKTPVAPSSSTSSSGGGGASANSIATVSSTPYQANISYEVNSQKVVRKWHYLRCGGLNYQIMLLFYWLQYLIVTCFREHGNS